MTARHSPGTGQGRQVEGARATFQFAQAETDIMRNSHSARGRLLALTVSLSSAGIALAGCGSVDEALFGPGSAAPPAAQTAEAAPAPAAPAPAEAPAPDAVTPADATSPIAAPAAPPVPGMQLAAIEPGNDTGTSVGQTVQRLRGELSTLHDKIATDVQQYQTLKAASVQDVTTYQEGKSHIIIRLQTGTTKANPELVDQWNTSQSALDTLTGNINSLAALGTELDGDAGRAHTERSTIADTFNMTGAVDEDHRQLTTLQQEASDLSAMVDRLKDDVARNVKRETVFVANERSSLEKLQNDIKNGELYADTASAEMPAAGMAAEPAGPAKEIATIKFDRAKVDFEQDLYAALNQALQAKPGATFKVVAISPTRGSETAVQKAQSEAQHHAQDVLKSMTDMGVPATRVAISSSTDPSAKSAEVRVYAN
jgi:hypothetical protein